MMTQRFFLEDADRYKFDFNECSPSGGWAQVDTGQDAWYYGTWANPARRMVCTYAEGDVTINTAESDEEFVTELRRIKEWCEENGIRFLGIDPMMQPDIERGFRDLGLGDLLH